VLVIDETAFQAGQGIVGAARQYRVRQARFELQSASRYLTSASWHAFIDRALYFRRNGPTIQIAWKPKKPMVPAMSALRPNQSLRRE